MQKTRAANLRSRRALTIVAILLAMSASVRSIQNAFAQEHGEFVPTGTLYSSRGEIMDASRFRINGAGAQPRMLAYAIENIERTYAELLAKSQGLVLLTFIEKSPEDATNMSAIRENSDGSIELTIGYAKRNRLTGQIDDFEMPKKPEPVVIAEPGRPPIQPQDEKPSQSSKPVMVSPVERGSDKVPVIPIQGTGELPLLNEIPDYLVLKYYWKKNDKKHDESKGVESSRDVDVRVGIIDQKGRRGNYVGYAREKFLGESRARGVPSVRWSDDNIEFGYESVLIDLKTLREAGKLQDFDVILRGFWYRGEESGSVFIEATAYQGGKVWLDKKKFLFFANGSKTLGSVRFSAWVRPAIAGTASKWRKQLIEEQEAYLEKNPSAGSDDMLVGHFQRAVNGADSSLFEERKKDDGQFLGLIRFDTATGQLSLLEASNSEAQKRLRGAKFR